MPPPGLALYRPHPCYFGFPPMSVEMSKSLPAQKALSVPRCLLLAFVSILLVGAFLATGCGPKTEPYRVVTLTNGNEFRLREMRPAPAASGERGFYLSYQTDLAREEIQSLRAEIQEIWIWFLRPQLEQANIPSALIVATMRHQDGWERSGYEFKMVYRKTPQGWVRN